MMKKNYLEPECSLILLKSADLIALSLENEGDGDDWDW